MNTERRCDGRLTSWQFISIVKVTVSEVGVQSCPSYDKIKLVVENKATENLESLIL